MGKKLKEQFARMRGVFEHLICWQPERTKDLHPVCLGGDAACVQAFLETLKRIPLGQTKEIRCFVPGVEQLGQLEADAETGLKFFDTLVVQMINLPSIPRPMRISKDSIILKLTPALRENFIAEAEAHLLRTYGYCETRVTDAGICITTDLRAID